MDQAKTPLYDALARKAAKQLTSFHVPGHKFGAGLDPRAAAYYQPIMQMDYTELDGLDDLHQPQDVIRESQALAAACFGAEQTWFLVNGSTVGNLALILTVCEQDDLILVQRDCHKSVFHGLMLSGARAVFLNPEQHPDGSLALGLALHTVEEAIRRHPDAKGLLVTNPNYYGWGVNLTAIAEACHASGIPLLVDEAHGAHYGFHPALPPSALSCGADAVVQSTHKMLGAMTMGAMLHSQGQRIDREALSRHLSMLQSSSPSYPIMASLDLARRWVHEQGAAHLGQALQHLHTIDNHLKRMPFFQHTIFNDLSGGYWTKDPFKITLSAAGFLTGYQLKSKLEQAGCIMEMADPLKALAVCSYATTDAHCQRLLVGLQSIVEETITSPVTAKNKNTFHAEEAAGAPSSILDWTAFVSEPIPFAKHGIDVRYQEMASNSRKNKGKSHIVLFADSVGAISAEMVIPYPPGIPMLIPGERITGVAVQRLTQLSAAGTLFHGTHSPNLTHIKIYE